MSEQVEGQLTLFPADSPASRSPLPGSGEARKMTAISGQKWLGLSRNSGPLGLLEKMLLESCEWHSPIYYLNWRPVDIGQEHFLFQLVLSEPDTDDTGSQLWVAPNLREWKTPIASDASNRKMYTNSRGEPNLSGQVKIWPTPKASDCKGSGHAESRSAEHDRKRGNLKGVVMYATPQARDYRTGQASRWEDREHRSRNLNDQIAMYQTPTTGPACVGEQEIIGS